jgi:hypothetical protein
VGVVVGVGVVEVEVAASDEEEFVAVWQT